MSLNLNNKVFAEIEKRGNFNFRGFIYNSSTCDGYGYKINIQTPVFKTNKEVKKVLQEILDRLKIVTDIDEDEEE